MGRESEIIKLNPCRAYPSKSRKDERNTISEEDDYGFEICNKKAEPGLKMPLVSDNSIHAYLLSTSPP